MHLYLFYIYLLDVNGLEKCIQKKSTFQLTNNHAVLSNNVEQPKDVNGFNPSKPIFSFTSQQQKQQKQGEDEGSELLICAGLNLTKSQEIEELIVGRGLYNDNCNDISKMKVDLSELKKLKRIEIGWRCFKHVREFVVDDLDSLESVKIGKYCFRISGEERNDGVCRITNCPNLRQLEIGDRSFRDFQSFELSNLNSIQSIKFGHYCFKYTDFSLKGE